MLMGTAMGTKLAAYALSIGKSAQELGMICLDHTD